MLDYGHPDQGSGPAPLPGTNHFERMMHSSLEAKSKAHCMNRNLLVKKEWDEALWQQWWQEVKDGKRRYRFEGSEEWLPTDSAAPPPGMKRPPKDGRLPGSAGPVKDALPSGQAGADRPDPAGAGTLVWPWVAGGVVVTGLGLWWLRRRGAS